MQPNTCLLRLKSLFAAWKEFGVQYSLSDFKGFSGSLVGVSTVRFAEEQAKDPLYGTKPNTVDISEADDDRIKEYLSNELYDLVPNVIAVSKPVCGSKNTGRAWVSEKYLPNCWFLVKPNRFLWYIHFHTWNCHCQIRDLNVNFRT